MQTAHNVTCILLALVKPSYTLLPATNHPKHALQICILEKRLQKPKTVDKLKK